jgi:predicted Kef-type K+ transport protein
MISRETVVVLGSGTLGTALAVALGSTGSFDRWTGLGAFVYLGLFWYAIPQVALAASDDELSGLRVRLIPVILFFLAIAVTISPLASGRELLGIWGIVAVALAVLVGSAFRRGYQEATQGEDGSR